MADQVRERGSGRVVERQTQGAGDDSAAADGVPTITATVRYFAAARAAAGVSEELLTVPAGEPSTVGDPGTIGPSAVGHPGTVADSIAVGAASTVGALLDRAAERHGPELTRILLRCSFLLDEVAVHGRATPLGDGQVLDVLPPFAGG